MVLKTLISELKAHTVFYTLTFWVFVFVGLSLFDKFHRRSGFLKTEREVLSYVRDKFTNEDEMKEIVRKWESIKPETEFLYLDSGIIHILWNIREYELYSKEIWIDIVNSLDKFFKIIFYVSKYPEAIYLDNLLNIKLDVLNSLHQMIFNLPTNDYHAERKLKKAIESIQYILNLRIEEIRYHVNLNFKKNPNITNKYVSKQNILGYNLAESKTLNSQMF